MSRENSYAESFYNTMVIVTDKKTGRVRKCFRCDRCGKWSTRTFGFDVKAKSIGITGSASAGLCKTCAKSAEPLVEALLDFCLDKSHYEQDDSPLGEICNATVSNWL